MEYWAGGVVQLIACLRRIVGSCLKQNQTTSSELGVEAATLKRQYQEDQSLDHLKFFLKKKITVGKGTSGGNLTARVNSHEHV